MKIRLLSAVIALLCATHSAATHFLRKEFTYTVTADLVGYGDKPEHIDPQAAYYCSKTRQYSQALINEVVAFSKAKSVYRYYLRPPINLTKPTYPIQVVIDGFRVYENFIVHPISPNPEFFYNPSVEVKDYVIMDYEFNFITIVYTLIEQWESVIFNQCFPLIPTKPVSQVFLYYPGSPLGLSKAIQPDIVPGSENKIINWVQY
ncbi:BgTH12-05673 [Blumeria graminis f. sp. triticale]|uniref:BgTH12-05673 n=1 Tax=Blumeria graminis f. sp. triticale TaxID=1689686 RepID=A0A9W4GHI7_BLUGR|nr:BgTH12-05673 [Blumeria graminis f. sp. triticale]